MPMRPNAGPPAASAWWRILDPRCSLRARATYLAGGCAVLFTAFVILTARGLAQRQARQQLGTLFETWAVQISDKLDRGLQERHRQLQLLATLPLFRGWDGAMAERRQALEAALHAEPNVAWIGFVDPTGLVVSGTDGRFENTQVGSQPWFRLGRERSYIGDVQELPAILPPNDDTAEDAGPATFVTIAVPVRSAQNEFRGIVAAHVRWSIAREVQLSVVSELARRERIGVTIYGAQGEVLRDSGGLGWSEPPALPRVPAGQRARGSMVEITREGPTFLSGYALNRDYKTLRALPWLVVVRQPSGLAFAAIGELQRTIILWGLGLVAATVTATWIWAGRFARQMNVVGAAARRIGAGDILSTMPRPAGKTELEEMCGDLRNMVDDLRAESPSQASPPPPSPHPW